MLIVDGHLDLAWNGLQWNRDLRQPVQAIRSQEASQPGKGRGMGTVALPEMRQGRVFLSFATLLARCTGTAVPHLDYPSQEQAYAAAQGQLAYYRALAAGGHLRMITNRNELDAHVSVWRAWEEGNGRQPVPGVIISMEGADPVRTPDQLAAWQAQGLRLLGFAHYGPGRYAGGTGTDSGFTAMGYELLKQVKPLGIILDLTHLSDAAFWQTLSHYDGPVIASHNNCRTLVPHQRQFDDAQLTAIIERDGVIGVALDAWMLVPGWVQDRAANPPVLLADVVTHIDHICQLAGSARHVAIGSDLDGGFGREQSPADLDTIADLQQVGVLLAGRGYAPDDIAAIMHGNWLRVLQQNWKKEWDAD